MVPAKKHPLEVFRKHGPFTSGSMTTRKSKPARKSGGILAGLNTSMEHGQKERTARRGGGKSEKNGAGHTASRRSRKPATGDQKFTLSLNGVLFIAVIIVGLSIAAYFFGYRKGRKDTGIVPRSMGLQQTQRTSAPGDDIGEYRVQESDREWFMGDPQQGGHLLYGVQVGTWGISKSGIAKEANAWLRKNGYNSRLYPFANGKKLIIIVGSFRSRQDQELNTLLERIRSIDNYPYGASSPFKDARIKPFSVKGAGN